MANKITVGGIFGIIFGCLYGAFFIFLVYLSILKAIRDRRNIIIRNAARAKAREFSMKCRQSDLHSGTKHKQPSPSSCPSDNVSPDVPSTSFHLKLKPTIIEVTPTSTPTLTPLRPSSMTPSSRPSTMTPETSDKTKNETITHDILYDENTNNSGKRLKNIPNNTILSELNQNNSTLKSNSDYSLNVPTFSKAPTLLNISTRKNTEINKAFEME